MIKGDAHAAREIVEKILKVKIHAPFSGIVSINGGRYTAAWIFNNYDGRDIHITCVSAGLWKVGEARVVARYVFETLGCHRCTAITRGTNERAIKALRQLGFVREGQLREHFADADGAVFGLLRSEQRIVRM